MLYIFIFSDSVIFKNFIQCMTLGECTGCENLDFKIKEKEFKV